ncbi:MAG: T9SS type A sorting domain-containing protein [Spirochaetes bacterium]|nr:T9SS type A sorting domain-containing protein [Spirochaetota bacterium]
MVGALTNNNLVGCHWFEFIDQPVTGRWHDGENRQCGFIDNCDTVYPEMVVASRGLSKTMYTLRYNSGLSPDQIPPEVTGAPGSVLTNNSFTVNLDVDKNFGYWSTNASAFQQFTTAGTSIVIDRTTTLRVYGASNTVSSVTDTFVYTFDTAPPAVSGMPAGMTTNRSFTINLDVNENTGYWSTNGSAFMPFTTNGVSIFIDRTTALRSYGRDVLGNNGTTNTQTYTVIKCDLVVDSISWSPSAPKPGDTVTFSGVLSNAGLYASPLTNHSVTFWVDGVYLSYGVKMTNLLPGQKIVVDASSAVWTATAGTHTIRAMADDADRIQEADEGNNNRTNYLDMEAPLITGAPSNFTTNKSFSVSLAVNENYGYWSTNGSPFTQFTTGGTSFPVAATTTLRFYGRDTIGNNGVTNTRTYTVDGRIPDSPGSFTVNAGANAVVLSWVDLATNESAYRVYRSIDGLTYSFIGTAPANAARYTNDGLACGMTYYYRIAATNAYGESLTGPVTAITVPRLAVSGGTIELVPANNIMRYTCTLSKDCIEPVAVLFRISPSGSNSFLSLGGTMRGLMQIPSGGTYTYEWTPPEGLDTTVHYDLFTEIQTAGTSSAPHIVSNIDLSRLFTVQRDLERVFAVNNPSRGSTPIVFANLSRDASVQIYSVSGRSVAALLAESNGTARWNLSAHNGRRVAPGVYICRITSATGEKTVKVIVR